MTKKNLAIILVILILSFLMRFLNFSNFGYFTGDEEIFHSMIKKVTTEGKPPLVIPNAQIGGSIGSFFVLLISPIFALLNNDPQLVQMIGPVIGLLTTLVIFWVGNLIAGQKMGIIVAIFYSGSFIVSLFDRRLWTLSLDPLMILFAIGALVKIVQKKYSYSLLLVVAVSFTWHSDPAIAIAILASIISLIIFRIPIWKKEFIPAWIYLFISVLPFAIFELRHPGTIFKPWFMHITQRSVVETSLFERMSSINVINTIANLSRSLFSSPTNMIEQYFCYCKEYPAPFLSPIPELLTILILGIGLIWVIRAKSGIYKNNLIILLTFIAAFLLGITIYTTLLSYDVYQHYFVVVFPSFLLLTAFILNNLLKRLPWLVIGFMGTFLLVNFWALFNSSLYYPLSHKEVLVQEVIPEISASTFSIYGVGDYMSLFDGGWVSLLDKYNLSPNRSYLNGGWDFIYRTHSLYSYNPDQDEGQKIVIFHDLNDQRFNNSPFSERNKETLNYKNISATIFDNNDNWFDVDFLK